MSEPLWKTLEDALVTRIGGITGASSYDIRAISPLEFARALDVDRITKLAVLSRIVSVNYVPIGVGLEPIHDAQFTFEVLIVDKIRSGASDKFRGDIATVYALVRDRVDNHLLVTSPYQSSPLRPVSETPRDYSEGFVGISCTWETKVQYNG